MEGEIEKQTQLMVDKVLISVGTEARQLVRRVVEHVTGIAHESVVKRDGEIGRMKKESGKQVI